MIMIAIAQEIISRLDFTEVNTIPIKNQTKILIN